MSCGAWSQGDLRSGDDEQGAAADCVDVAGSEAAMHGPDNALRYLAKSKKDLRARLILSGALVSAPDHGGQE